MTLDSPESVSGKFGVLGGFQTDPAAEVVTTGAPGPADTSALLPVTPALGVIMVVLLGAATGIAALGRLGHGWATVRAGMRAVAQLAIVSVVITTVVTSLPLTLVFVVVMYAVASHTAGRRITPDRSWWCASLPIVAGPLPVLVLLIATGLVPMRGLVVIPVAGILIGGALTATVLAGRRALDDLAQRYGEVEAALTLGLSLRHAKVEICRPAAAGALVPALDQTRTVGLVTLPGAFVGMLLGGASPVAAGAVQVFLLIALLAVESAAIVVTVELVARGLLR